jgi:calcineurin-like phosphoesterase family protein
MDRRGFESGEAMNEYMIKQWNSRVSPGDEVVILGDFCLDRKSACRERV